MSVTRSIEFYCGKKCILKEGIFGTNFYDYEYTNDIAYKDIDFSVASKELRSYMATHNIKVGYCDISYELGGGYTLFKRYTFINKYGKFITKKIDYAY